MAYLYSPLRYPGGKGRIAPYFKRILRDNLLCDGLYIEPYAGGASVALSLLLDCYVSKVIINDIDRSIYAFWSSVLNNTDEFCELIENTPVNIPVWKEQMDMQRNKEQCDLFELGFSTFFLNRTNRSGIISGGVIGGIKQDGIWKIDARYNKNELIERIRRIEKHKKRIELHNLDALKFLRSIQLNLPENSIFYLDPPYYKKGSMLYLNYYTGNDHRKIYEELWKMKHLHWILTYDNVDPIKDLYAEYRMKEYNLQYSASKSRKGQELMIFSDNVHISEQLA